MPGAVVGVAALPAGLGETVEGAAGMAPAGTGWAAVAPGLLAGAAPSSGAPTAMSQRCPGWPWGGFTFPEPFAASPVAGAEAPFCEAAGSIGLLLVTSVAGPVLVGAGAVSVPVVSDDAAPDCGASFWQAVRVRVNIRKAGNTLIAISYIFKYKFKEGKGTKIIYRLHIQDVFLPIVSRRCSPSQE